MKVYITTKNTGPSWNSDPLHMLYLGTSLEAAVDAVGDFVKYEVAENDWDHWIGGFPYLYTILPRITIFDWKFTKFYFADGWWYSIVEFELEVPV